MIKLISLSGQNFTYVGSSLIRYEEGKVPYEFAHRRCLEVFKANLVVFRNKQEWNEVTETEFYLSNFVCRILSFFIDFNTVTQRIITDQSEV